MPAACRLELSKHIVVILFWNAFKQQGTDAWVLSGLRICAKLSRPGIFLWTTQ